MRLTNNQRHLPSPDEDSLLLEEAYITSFCEVVLLDKPAVDTARYVAPVSKLSSRPALLQEAG